VNTVQLHVLDRTDRRILALLQKDGSISNLELADSIGLSPSPCSRRVKALADAGILRQTVTLLDAKALGLNLMSLISISMDRHTPDYQLKVIVQDMEAYQQFLLGKLTKLEGVTGVHSSFVMRKVVNTTALPLESGENS